MPSCTKFFWQNTNWCDTSNFFYQTENCLTTLFHMLGLRTSIYIRLTSWMPTWWMPAEMSASKQFPFSKSSRINIPCTRSFIEYYHDWPHQENMKLHPTQIISTAEITDNRGYDARFIGDCRPLSCTTVRRPLRNLPALRWLFLEPLETIKKI